MMKPTRAACEEPAGHVETPALAWGRTPEEAEERIKLLSLWDVKGALEEALAAEPGEW